MIARASSVKEHLINSFGVFTRCANISHRCNVIPFVSDTRPGLGSSTSNTNSKLFYGKQQCRRIMEDKEKKKKLIIIHAFKSRFLFRKQSITHQHNARKKETINNNRIYSVCMSIIVSMHTQCGNVNAHQHFNVNCFFLLCPIHGQFLCPFLFTFVRIF